MPHQRNRPVGDINLVLNQDGDVVAIRQVYTCDPVSGIAYEKSAGQADIDAWRDIVIKTEKSLTRHSGL